MPAPYKVHAFLKEKFAISQYYGENPEYYAQFGLEHGHEGVDIATPNGTEIFSPLDGIVVRDGFNDKDYGNFVVIWDAIQKCALWFCHLQDVLVNPSDTVHAGQLVAHTNNTGNTRGAHVHVNFVETDENGYRINMDNGEQGFLNLLDANLVSIVPFPGLNATDPQTPIPNASADEEETTIQTEDVNADGTTTPAAPAAPVQPATPQVDKPANPQTSLPANSPTLDAVCDFLGIPHDSSQTLVLDTLQQQKVDLTTKLKDVTDKYTADLGNYQVMQAAGFSTLDDIDNKLGEVTKNNEGLQKQILQVNKSNAALAEQLKAKNEEDSTAIEMGLNAQSKVKDLEATLQAIAEAHGVKPTLNSILSAVSMMQGKVETLLKQLTKKNITQDVQVAQQVAATINPTQKKQNAWDFVASLVLGQGKAVN
ncbi:MAG: M23 family metallopeptidase [Patescibacteria group bacterium]|nr:M23 family metallopeptidase [Patescibacteria group bacterium]